MGINRLIKHLAPGETLEQVLYQKLTGNHLSERSYRIRDLGEGMAVVSQVINGWWKPRYVLNHSAQTAFEFMSYDQYLLTVEADDIEWTTLKHLPEQVLERAKLQWAIYPTFVDTFSRGVARVRWQLNPDGRYFMDEDGFGMTDDVEVEIYGYINKAGQVVGKFRLLGEKEDGQQYRLQAEEEEKKGWLA